MFRGSAGIWSLPKIGDPDIDPKMLQSILKGRKMTLNFGKDPYP